MRLSDVAVATLEESRFAFICEEGEGPRWKFDYDNATKDPHPDILLLGAYRHPNTGNNLVGGINLNYLNDHQRDKLASVLPKIMQGKNLRDRYRVGAKAVPDVFDEFYRTYNPRFIRGVNTDIMYPKYGLLKTTQQWVKKKLSNIFKTKAQRQKALQPKYPEDLDSMQDRLNQVVKRLQQQPEVREKPTQPEPPELTTARDAFNQQRLQKTEKDIKRREDIPLKLAQQDYKQEIEQQQAIERGREEFEQERQKNRQELLNPENEIDLDVPTPDLDDIEVDADIEEPEEEEIKPALEGMISYYSPLAGHTIFEPFQTAISHDNGPLFLESWGNERTLSGEYWLSDGSAMYAENDYDHTMHVIFAAQQIIAEEFFDSYDEEVDWEEFKIHLSEEYPNLKDEIKMTWDDPRPGLADILFQHGISLELWNVANWIGDIEPRLYAAKNWGWVRNEGNNLEAFELSRSKLREIADGLGDAYPEEELERQSFDLYVYSNQKFFRAVPFDVIESGDVASLRDYG